MEALGSLFYRLGDTFLPLGVLLLVLGTQEVDGTPEAFLWVMAGFGLAFFGQLLRILTIGFTEISYGEETGGLYAERLIQDGLYAFLRNPLYLGNFLIGVGLHWLSHRPMLLVCGALGLWVWTLLLVEAEEAYLEERFKEAYTLYKKRVPRFFPHRKSPWKALSPRRFETRRVLVKEADTVFAWTGTFFLMLARGYGEPLFRPSLLPILGACLLMLSVTWRPFRLVLQRAKKAPLVPDPSKDYNF
jgi:protein-S-isoprenylcysteine O-methyltransferase Ste14